MKKTMMSIAFVALTMASFAQAAVIPVANFDFRTQSLNALNNASLQLTAVNPAGLNNFVADTVFGQQQQVYRFGGTTSQQGGLALSTNGLLGAAFAVDMVFSFDQLTSGYQRIIDLSNRRSDSGLYSVESGRVQLYNDGFRSAQRLTTGYNRLTVTTDGNGSVQGYLNGQSMFNLQSNLFSFATYSSQNPTKLLSFFLDDAGEWQSGRVASIRLYNQQLSSQDALDIGNNQLPLNQVPLPTTAALMLGGLLLMRRRKSAI